MKFNFYLVILPWVGSLGKPEKSRVGIWSQTAAPGGPPVCNVYFAFLCYFKHFTIRRNIWRSGISDWSQCHFCILYSLTPVASTLSCWESQLGTNPNFWLPDWPYWVNQCQKCHKGIHLSTPKYRWSASLVANCPKSRKSDQSAFKGRVALKGIST